MNQTPHYLNPNFLKKQIGHLKVNDLFEEIKKGSMVALSKGITLLESELKEHKEKATELLKLSLPLAGNSIRIGITGTPGAGKSTFIETIGKNIIAEKNKLAILAIDPSSMVTKGSILGDKTRMEELSRMPEVFIRPSPTMGNLGGVARATKETMILCELAGFNVIMIETVGVGQSEIELHYLTDIFLLLLIPGAGDELQGIKRGIMEMADIILVNKAEKENISKADLAVSQLESAVHYLQKNKYGRGISVHAISALFNTNVMETWSLINTNLKNWKDDNSFANKRKMQASYWFEQSITSGLKNIIQKQPNWNNLYLKLKLEVEDGSIHPFAAADEILNKIVENK